MTTKTNMLSTDSDFSRRYAAKYSVAALLPWVAAIHSPSASPSPTHPMTHATSRDERAPASVLGRRAAGRSAGRSGSGAVLTIGGMLTWRGEGVDQVPNIPVSTPTPNYLSTALMNAQLSLSQDEKTISDCQSSKVVRSSHVFADAGHLFSHQASHRIRALRQPLRNRRRSAPWAPRSARSRRQLLRSP